MVITLLATKVYLAQSASGLGASLVPDECLQCTGMVSRKKGGGGGAQWCQMNVYSVLTPVYCTSIDQLTPRISRET